MNSPHLVAASIGITLTLAIIYLVRADHISPKVAARWFLLALLVLTVSLAPEVVDWIGIQLGIAYPPILPILVAIAVAMVKILIMDIERQKMQIKIDRLVQKVSVMEAMYQSTSNVAEKENSKPAEHSPENIVRISDKTKHS